jgi:endogenous inhibitor of DNA gyrase (YacG/DUF329 family)
MCYTETVRQDKQRGVFSSKSLRTQSIVVGKHPVLLDTPSRCLGGHAGDQQHGVFAMATRYCTQCGKTLKAKQKAYCSRGCMAEGYKTRMVGEDNPHYSNASLRICAVCGKEYHHYAKNRKYCSDRCKGKSPENLARLQQMAHAPKHRKPTFVKGRNCRCVQCGKTWKSPTQRTHCEDCSTYGKRSLRTCIVCGDTFKSAKRILTCSVKCRRTHASMAQQGEKSHRWQGGKTSKSIKARRLPGYRMWRESVFERDNYTCQLCGQRGGKLTAHHIKLFSQHPEYALDTGNGITLCWTCHSGIRHKEAQYEERFFAITGGLQKAVVRTVHEALALLGAKEQ